MAFFIFWAVVILGRKELGWLGVVAAASVWFVMILGMTTFEVEPYLFQTAQAILAIVMILIVFKGDIRIR